jgi:hypothetical protein
VLSKGCVGEQLCIASWLRTDMCLQVVFSGRHLHEDVSGLMLCDNECEVL